jgi:hypothetical protein
MHMKNLKSNYKEVAKIGAIKPDGRVLPVPNRKKYHGKMGKGELNDKNCHSTI